MGQQYNEDMLRREYAYVARKQLEQSLATEAGTEALIEQFIKDVEKASGIDKSHWTSESIPKVKAHYNNLLAPEVYQLMDKMLMTGYSLNQISRELGVSRNTVLKRKKRLGL